MPSLGLLRSLLIYYGVPFKNRRLTQFYSQFIRPGDLCFDLGAHVGNRLWAWSRLGAKVVAVEPQPEFASFLRRWYGDRPNIILQEIAVGASPGIQILHISHRYPTVSTLSQSWMESVSQAESFTSINWDTRLPVPVITLEGLISEYGEPTFCKIDVEGYELEVLRGLSRSLRALSFEYIPATIEIALGCLERLAQLGDYEYNWSERETSRLRSPTWLTMKEISTHLEGLPSSRASGDVYARLKNYLQFHSY